MKKIGYIFRAMDDLHYSSYKACMRKLDCQTIIEDELRDEQLRPQWHNVIMMLEQGDTLVVPKLSNVVRSSSGLSFLFEYCRSQKIRLISIGDHFDSSGNRCEVVDHTKFVDIIANLPNELNAIRDLYNNESKECSLLSFRPKSGSRNAFILNMYMAGYTIEDIIKESKTSNTTIYRLLERYGVRPNRKKDKTRS